MVNSALWTHWLLAAYLWLVTAVSLGNWNVQVQPHLFAALRSGHALTMGDAGFLTFIMLPALLFTFAALRRSSLAALSALIFDLIWLAMQVQSWWIPYLTGKPKTWQIKFAHGPTTKLLPSFHLHIAPDGMHLVITLLLLAALGTGIPALQLLRKRT